MASTMDTENPTSATRANGIEQASQAVMRRPGLVTFAAVMTFVLAGFALTWGIVEIAAAWDASWIQTTYGAVHTAFGGYLWIWGILDLLIAGAAFYAGYDILRGGQFGQVFSVMVAGFSAIRWFFYLPVAPLLGVVIIVLDVIIIYALIAHGEYFTQSTPY